MYDRKAPRVKNPKSARVSFRCTQAEFGLWTRYAERKGLTLPQAIANGLNTSVATTCLCAPGLPACPKCSRT